MDSFRYMTSIDIRVRERYIGHWRSHREAHYEQRNGTGMALAYKYHEDEIKNEGYRR